MKKTLVAIAALAATSAFAQSSVTMYGNLDQTVFYGKSAGASMISSNSNGGSTSLFGLTGTEDLGGGTRASFDLKSELTLLSGTTGSSSTGLNQTTSKDQTHSQATSSNMFNRGAWVGVDNKEFGAFKIGRQNDSWWENTTKFNNTGINSFGWSNATAMVSGTNALNLLYGGNQLSTLQGLGVKAVATVNPTTGLTNPASYGTGAAFFGGLSYETPTWNGLTAKYGKGAPKAGYTQDGDINNAYNYSLTYSNGPLTAAYAVQNKLDTAGASGMKNTMMAAKYVMGQYTVTFANNATRIGGTAKATDGGHDADVNALGLGYALNGAWNIDVAYTQAKDKTEAGNKWTQTAVVGKYAISKRTSWYAGYGRSKNEGKSAFGGVYAGNANTVPAAGNTDATILTGLRHQF